MQNLKKNKINLATETELAETKITAGKISTEHKSKSYEYWTKLRKMELNFVFFDCVVNSNQLRQDLKAAEEKLQRDLKGRIKFYQICEID